MIYTELNQYYVVMEVAPKYWQSPDGLKDTYLIPNSGGGRDSAGFGDEVCAFDEPAGGESYGAVSFGDGVLQSGAGCFAEPGDEGDQPDSAEPGRAGFGAW